MFVVYLLCDYGGVFVYCGLSAFSCGFVIVL